MFQEITDLQINKNFLGLRASTNQKLYHAGYIYLTRKNEQRRQRYVYLSNTTIYITHRRYFFTKFFTYDMIYKIIISTLSGQFVFYINSQVKQDILFEDFEQRQKMINIIKTYNKSTEIVYKDETTLDKYLRGKEKHIQLEKKNQKSLNFKMIRDMIQENNLNDEIKLQDFKIVKLLNVNKKCKIYLANSKSQQKYVLKSIRISYLIQNPQYLNQILEQKRNSEIIKSPFICKLLYGFKTNYRIYLVYQYISNQNLGTLLTKKYVFAQFTLKIILAQIITAIGHIHQAGFTYNNLLLSHIFLDEFGNIKLINLSKCLHIEEQKNQDNYQIQYQSPERIQSKINSITNDWWTVGIILYQLLFKRHPFKGNTQEQTKNNIINQQINLNQFQFSKQFQTLLTSLLLKNKDQRIGKNNSYHEILAHPFFKQIKLNELKKKKNVINFSKNEQKQTKNEQKQLEQSFCQSVAINIEIQKLLQDFEFSSQL